VALLLMKYSLPGKIGIMAFTSDSVPFSEKGELGLGLPNANTFLAVGVFDVVVICRERLERRVN
jgi:hypothetical protein